MTGKGMTSVSVSYEVRRQLNTMRTMGDFASVDDLLRHLIREHKVAKMSGTTDKLRDRVKEAADVDVNHLVERLNLSPFKV